MTRDLTVIAIEPCGGPRIRILSVPRSGIPLSGGTALVRGFKSATLFGTARMVRASGHIGFPECFFSNGRRHLTCLYGRRMCRFRIGLRSSVLCHTGSLEPCPKGVFGGCHRFATTAYVLANPSPRLLPLPAWSIGHPMTFVVIARLWIRGGIWVFSVGKY